MPVFSPGCDSGFVEGLERSEKAHLMELHFVSPFVSLWWVGRASLPRQFDGVYKALWTGGVAGRSLCGCRKQQGTVFSVKVDRGCPWVHALYVIQCVGANVSIYRDQHTEVKGRRSAEAMTQSLWKSGGTSFFARTWALLFPGRAHAITSSQRGPERVGWGGEKKLLCRCLEWCCCRSSVGTDPHYCRQHKLISFELERVSLHSGQVL